jgi:hypothetical protein
MTSTLETAAADVQDRARQTYRQRVAADQTLTGRALGNMFGKSERWGRDRIAEVRTADDTRQDDDTRELEIAAALPAVERQPVAAETAVTAPITAAAEPVAAVQILPSGVSAAVQWTTRIAVAIVAAVAAAVSYAHMYSLAHHAGEDWRSWLLPLSVDGLIVASSMTLLVRKRQGQSGGFLAYSAMWLGVLVSLGANIAAAAPTLEGRLVAAWPPLALLYGYELLMRQVKSKANGKVKA